MKTFVQKILDSKFSRDTIWLIGAQFSVLLVGFCLNYGVEGHYGLEELGYFTQTTSYYLIFSNLFALGLNNTTIKRVAENTNYPEKQRRIFSQNLILSILISIGLSLVVLLFLMLFPKVFSSDILVELLSIQMIGVPFFSANKQFAAFYSGQRMQKQFAIQRLIRWLGIGILLFMILLLDYPLFYVIIAFVIVEIILFIYNFLLNWSSLSVQFAWDEIKRNLSFGLKSYVAEILAVFNSNVDIILLGYLLTSRDLGIYSFMIFFVKALYIFPGIIMQNVNPLISSLWESKQIDELQRKIRSITKVNTGIAVLQFAGVVGAYYVIISLFKKSMAGSEYYFMLGAAGALIFSLVSWSGSMLVMSGKLRANFNRTLTILLVSTTSILVFSYYWGLFGASLAIGVNGILNFVVMRQMIKKEMGITVFL